MNADLRTEYRRGLAEGRHQRAAFTAKLRRRQIIGLRSLSTRDRRYPLARAYTLGTLRGLRGS